MIVVVSFFLMRPVLTWKLSTLSEDQLTWIYSELTACVSMETYDWLTSCSANGKINLQHYIINVIKNGIKQCG